MSTVYVSPTSVIPHSSIPGQIHAGTASVGGTTTAETTATTVEAAAGETAASQEVAATSLATRLSTGARVVAPYAAPVGGLATTILVGLQAVNDDKAGPDRIYRSGEYNTAIGFAGLTPERLNRLEHPTLAPIDSAIAKTAKANEDKALLQRFLPEAREAGFKFDNKVTADQFRAALYAQAKKMGIKYDKHTPIADIINGIKAQGGVDTRETVVATAPIKPLIKKLNPEDQKLIDKKAAEYKGEIADLANQLSTKSYKGKPLNAQVLQNIEKEYERAQRELRRVSGHDDYATFKVNTIIPLNGAKPAPTPEKGGLLKPPSLVDGGTSGNKGTAPKPATAAAPAPGKTTTSTGGQPTQAPAPTTANASAQPAPAPDKTTTSTVSQPAPAPDKTTASTGSQPVSAPDKTTTSTVDQPTPAPTATASPVTTQPTLINLNEMHRKLDTAYKNAQEGKDIKEYTDAVATYKAAAQSYTASLAPSQINTEYTSLSAMRDDLDKAYQKALKGEKVQEYLDSIKAYEAAVKKYNETNHIEL